MATFAASPIAFVAYVKYVQNNQIWLQFEHDRSVRVTGLIDVLAVIHGWQIVVWEIVPGSEGRWQGNVRSIINPEGKTQKHIRHRFNERRNGQLVSDHFEQMESSRLIPLTDLKALRQAEYCAWITESSLFDEGMREALTSSKELLEWSGIVLASGREGSALVSDFNQWREKQRPPGPPVVSQEYV